jgi:carbamoyl-phosphate synthase large subunit
VLPFHRFRTVDGRCVDARLGPEMKSTGEVMGFGDSFDIAFAKAQLAAGTALPVRGRVLVTVALANLPRVAGALADLQEAGLEIETADRAARILWSHRVEAYVGDQNDVAGIERRIRHHEFCLVVSLPADDGDREVDRAASAAAAAHGVAYVTTVSGLLALARAIRAAAATSFGVRSLQARHANPREEGIEHDELVDASLGRPGGLP